MIDTSNEHTACSVYAVASIQALMRMQGQNFTGVVFHSSTVHITCRTAAFNSVQIRIWHCAAYIQRTALHASSLNATVCAPLADKQTVCIRRKLPYQLSRQIQRQIEPVQELIIGSPDAGNPLHPLHSPNMSCHTTLKLQSPGANMQAMMRCLHVLQAHNRSCHDM